MTILALVRQGEEQVGAAEVVRLVNLVGGQLEQAYRLNEWDDESLHDLEDAASFLADAAMDLWRMVRADRGMRIIRALPVAYESPLASAGEGDDVAQSERAMYGKPG